MNDQPYSRSSGKAEDPEADFKGAPDIDHTNPRVQSELSEWMKWLMSDIGFDGWRFDFARGYAVSSVALYVQNTAPAFAVGEIWETLNFGNGENAHRQRLVDWVHSTGDRSAAFDFTTKGILQVAVQNNELWRLKDSDGKPSGMIGVLPEKAVTFVDNHDTGATQQNISAFPPDKLMQGYAYILTHPGVPTIFYEHFEDTNLKDSIKKLIEIRKRNKIKANSNCTIITAEDDLYMANIEERVVMKIGARFAVGNLEPSKEFFQLAISGKDYAVWERKP
ncbi:hypothetical protein SUGI_0078140 [Cryptomeria japonica]|nr:hypothetical protein SUGI_0078140 [Cryptomeria japonica]